MITWEQVFATELETIAVHEAPDGLIMQVIPQWMEALRTGGEFVFNMIASEAHTHRGFMSVSNPLQAALFERIRVRAEKLSEIHAQVSKDQHRGAR